MGSRSLNVVDVVRVVVGCALGGPSENNRGARDALRQMVSKSVNLC